MYNRKRDWKVYLQLFMDRFNAHLV